MKDIKNVVCIIPDSEGFELCTLMFESYSEKYCVNSTCNYFDSKNEAVLNAIEKNYTTILIGWKDVNEFLRLLNNKEEEE